MQNFSGGCFRTWTRGLLARRTWFTNNFGYLYFEYFGFYCSDIMVNDIGCSLLLVTTVASIKICLVQKQPPRGVPWKRCSENMQQIYRRTTIPKCDLNKVAEQLRLNWTLARVFSCKFAACFQNTFFWEHVSTALLFIFYGARLSSNSYWEKNIPCLSSPSEVFLGKDILKICSKFAKQLYWNCTSVRVLFLQICCIFPEHLFLKNILGGLFLYWQMNWSFE